MLSSAQQQQLMDATSLTAHQKLFAQKYGDEAGLANHDDVSDSNEDNLEAHNKRHQRIFDDDDEDCEDASQEDDVSDLSSGQDAYEVDDEPSDEVYADEDDENDAADSKNGESNGKLEIDDSSEPRD